MERTILTFYKFVSFPDFKEFKAKLEREGKRLSVLGTIILAEEGINATAETSWCTSTLKHVNLRMNTHVCTRDACFYQCYCLHMTVLDSRYLTRIYCCTICTVARRLHPDSVSEREECPNARRLLSTVL